MNSEPADLTGKPLTLEGLDYAFRLLMRRPEPIPTYIHPDVFKRAVELKIIDSEGNWIL